MRWARHLTRLSTIVRRSHRRQLLDALSSGLHHTRCRWRVVEDLGVLLRCIGRWREHWSIGSRTARVERAPACRAWRFTLTAYVCTCTYLLQQKQGLRCSRSRVVATTVAIHAIMARSRRTVWRTARCGGCASLADKNRSLLSCASSLKG